MSEHYKELGNTGVKVSKIGLGTWEFAQTDDWGTVDIKECRKLVDGAIDMDVNFFDTAEGYGESEKILGKLLKGKRNKVFLATKISSQQWDYDIVKKRIEGSLRRLQTEYVDLYQIHWPNMKKRRVPLKKDMEKKDYENIFTSLNKLKKEGIIRFAGVSNFRLSHLKEFSDEALNFILTNQVPYSLLWRFYEVEGVSNFCQQKNISFVSYSSLAQGFLTGMFDEKNRGIIGGIQKVNILFNEPIYGRALKVVNAVKEIAEEIGATPAQVALAWTIERRIITTALCGVKKFEELKENLAAIEICLTSEQSERLNAVSLEFASSMPPGLEMWTQHNDEEDIIKLGIK